MTEHAAKFLLVAIGAVAQVGVVVKHLSCGLLEMAYLLSSEIGQLLTTLRYRFDSIRRF